MSRVEARTAHSSLLDNFLLHVSAKEHPLSVSKMCWVTGDISFINLKIADLKADLWKESV